MRWSWKRAACGALAAFGLALAGGLAVGLVAASHAFDPGVRFATAIFHGANCAALFAIVGVPVGFAIGGLSGRRCRTTRADPPR